MCKTVCDNGSRRKLDLSSRQGFEQMNRQTYSSVSRYRPAHPFYPNRTVRSGLAQTLLTRVYSSKTGLFTRNERPILLDAGRDMTGVDPQRSVRLLGYYDRAPAGLERRGLVLSLHGWVGCSHSHYNLLVGSRLLEAGYDLFRLNLRDHGPGKHADPQGLNRGIFLGTLIDEVATAIRRVAEMAGDRPFYIIGASMGGNFALRLALRHGADPFHNLARVVAVSPAINPASATRALDANPLYLRYFRDRWVQTLRSKERLFPELYDFSDMDGRATVYEVTDYLIRKFGFFDSADAYFRTYAVVGDAFADLTVPTTVITAVNDPVIPVAEFYALATHPLLDVQIHPSGGHVGFADVLPVRHQLPEMVLEALQ